MIKNRFDRTNVVLMKTQKQVRSKDCGVAIATAILFGTTDGYDSLFCQEQLWANYAFECFQLSMFP